MLGVDAWWSQGLERMDQIKYAVLERSGGISIVPADQAVIVSRMAQGKGGLGHSVSLQ